MMMNSRLSRWSLLSGEGIVACFVGLPKQAWVPYVLIAGSGGYFDKRGLV